MVAAAAAVVAVGLAVLVSARPPGPTAPVTPASYSIFGDAVPAVPSVDDDRSVELGLRFRTASAGWVTALRFYQGQANTGPHEGTLWGPDGQPMAHASFPTSDGVGWQQSRLDAPVHLTEGATYTASYRAPSGHYAASTPSASPGPPVTTNALSAVEGVFTYGDGVPRESFKGTTYYVDVVFSTAAPFGTGSATAGGATPSRPVTTTGSTTPSRSGRPGPTTTGVPVGTTLTPYTGPRTITTAGTVIDAKDVVGALVIEAKDVVISRSKIHDAPDAVAGVEVTDTGSVTINDSEIYDFQLGITYSNWTAIRVNLHDLTSDGVKIGSDVRLQDSWLHAPRPSAGAHWDGGQVQAGVTNTVIQGNTIDVGSGDANSALFLAPDLGPSTAGPLTVADNWLDGGNFTLAVLDGSGGKYLISDISVTGNRFGRGGRYGPANVTVPVTWSDNRWDDTGAPVRR